MGEKPTFLEKNPEAQRFRDCKVFGEEEREGEGEAESLLFG